MIQPTLLDSSEACFLVKVNSKLNSAEESYCSFNYNSPDLDKWNIPPCFVQSDTVHRPDNKAVWVDLGRTGALRRRARSPIRQDDPFRAGALWGVSGIRGVYEAGLVCPAEGRHYNEGIQSSCGHLSSRVPSDCHGGWQPMGWGGKIHFHFGIHSHELIWI